VAVGIALMLLRRRVKPGTSGIYAPAPTPLDEAAA
jgi:hypothetical protein